MRLSIVIPALGPQAALEDGLVSVLEHRPSGSEVLVVFNSEYADPYGLRDELRFIDVAAGSSALDCLAAGARQARGEIVHFLAAGCEVQAGWAEQALAPFASPSVACVAPLLVETAAQARTGVVGWSYQRRGRPRLVSDASELLGPTRVAGFFRRDVLDSLASLGGLGVGDDLAFVALALRLQAAGYRSAHAELCRIVVPTSALAMDFGFRGGLHEECLFWRTAGMSGWAGSLAAHALLVASELPSALVRPRSLARLAGRAVATTAFLGLGRGNDLLANVSSEPLTEATAACLRIDSRHESKLPGQAPTADHRRSA